MRVCITTSYSKSYLKTGVIVGYTIKSHLEVAKILLDTPHTEGTEYAYVTFAGYSPIRGNHEN